MNVEFLEHTQIRKHIRSLKGTEMLHCPMDAFLTDYSPFFPNDTLVDATIKVLIDQKLLGMDDDCKTLAWKEFNDDVSSGATESKIYKPLEDFAAVFDDELGQVDRRQRHFFYCDLRCDEMEYEFPGSTCTVKACLIGNPSHARNKHAICAETAVVAELKKPTSKDFADNREKLVSAASHIMNDDPCRMWMYGITIENTKMAVWYFSRSHSVKSETFDFTKDLRTFIRVFLSFTYATREQMGYDPTVHRIEEEKSQYVYEIPTENGIRYFKTIASLAHPRALSITGRKTRVWKAVEVKGFEGNAVNEELNGGKTVALKDVWLDDGSTTEKQKLDAIFERLKTIKEEAYEWAPPSLRSELQDAFKNEGYRRYFMEIECDSFNLGKSKEKSDQAESAPEILQSRGVKVVDSDTKKFAVVKDKNLLEGSTQTIRHSRISENALTETVVSPLTVDTRLYAVKRQYRLIYSEVGESLDRAGSLDASFSAVLETYVALVLMYLAGWMHRDISVGNIIVVERGSDLFKGKLSDLEYAREFRDVNGSRDPKTGTPFFMPIEIHDGMTFSRLSRLDTPDDINVFKKSRVAQKVFKGTDPTRSSPRYRFQHDLESLWWVALWILIYRVVHPLGQKVSEKIFTPSSTPSLARRQLFTGKRVMGTLAQNLHPSLNVEDIINPMESIPRMLYDSYLTEKDLEPQALHTIYSKFFLFLSLLVRAAWSVEGVDLHGGVIVEPKKRPHPEAPAASKDRDSDEYEVDEEEPRSDDVVRKKKRKVQP
ncbi:hypothetical protein Agabi119p4_4861 [Agaricus bisporus var. burnettii]|uniref:Fungal-type protein kinase domain-containing protein n=1 Tax=Agaricus bisporus var. burnettii TaxID=192524 RepID=A0A8H7F490_AGABI|nr:hypothetical protein Agabi119p4_4861 [Agaricus bisporus var. burnettii]